MLVSRALAKVQPMEFHACDSQTVFTIQIAFATFCKACIKTLITETAHHLHKRSIHSVYTAKLQHDIDGPNVPVGCSREKLPLLAISEENLMPWDC